MAQLIGNIVQTRYSTYAFPNREEAEAFYLQVRDEARFAVAARQTPPTLKRASGGDRRAGARG